MPTTHHSLPGRHPSDEDVMHITALEDGEIAVEVYGHHLPHLSRSGATTLYRMLGEALKPQTPAIGDRYVKDDMSVDVHAVIDGCVYYRHWPKGVEKMPFLSNLAKTKLEDFIFQIQGAEYQPLTDHPKP